MLLLLAVAGVVTVVGTDVRPAAADTSVSLGLDRYHDMVVDDTRGHLFVSQGPGRDGVLVTSLEGVRVAMITGQPGASGLALSEDGQRLFVALANGDAVSVIDTSSLTEVARHPTGAGTCPTDLAATSTHVWYGYGCSSGATNRGVGSLDLRTSPPTNRAYRILFASWPLVSVAGDRMALGARRQSPAEVYTYDISSGEPVQLARSAGLGSDLQDLQVTPDGAQVITGFGSDDYHSVWKTQDLSADGVYPSGARPRAGSISPDNSLVAVGSYAPFGENAPDVRVFRREDSRLIRWWDFGTGYGMKLAERGLAFSSDGSRLYAVTTDSTITSETAEDPQLHVLENPGVFRTDLTVEAPATAENGDVITLSGRLSFVGDESTAGLQSLAVRRKDKDGERDLSGVLTDANGAYSLTDKVQYGLTRYTVTYPGDRWHEPMSRTVDVRVAAMPWDIDLDGHADLVVGTFREDLRSRSNAGMVAVLPGSQSGVSGAGAVGFSQAMASVPDNAEAGDEFGYSSTSADFNGDEFPDIAVSAPGEDVGGFDRAGTVIVMPGTARGPDPTRATTLTPLQVHPHGTGFRFGEALAAGDFDSDGYDDLAVGVPGMNWVAVYPGGRGGLDRSKGAMWDQETGVIPGISPSGIYSDEFGKSLAAGDANGDGFADLAIGAPRDNEDRGYASGSVTMLYGSDQGLTDVGSQRWTRDSPGIQEQPRVWNSSKGDAPDDFGARVSLADHDGDGYDDLAAGAPGAPRWYAGTRRADAGSLSLLYGSMNGITDRDQLLAQGRLGISGVPGHDDHFGSALAVGEVQGDGTADLAVTAASEGSVTVLTGSADGLGLAGVTRYTQATPGVPGAHEKEDRFGASLRMASFDGDSQDDLAIGVPGENSGRGAVLVLYSHGASGLSTAGPSLLSQGSPGVPDSPEAGDWFGSFF